MSKIATPPDAPQTPAILYGAKSTEDTRGSIATQLADARAMAEREGWEVIGEFSDDGFSGWKGNRGPQFAEAKEAAIAAAAERGTPAMLVAQHSDRFARGAGITPGAADHLAEVFFAMRRLSVHLRSAQDDANLDDALRAVLIGERNNEDSRRKSEAVRAGKRRQFAEAERLGGPVPDGYLLRINRDHADRVIARVYLLDPEREEVIARLFALALAGMADAAIARRLNAEGYRTRSHVLKSGPRKGERTAPKPWTRRRVQDTVTNPFYAGRVARGRSTPGQLEWVTPTVHPHPRYVEPREFDSLAAMRASRDRAAGSDRSPKGRPNENHLLAKLAVCGLCDAPMLPVTSTYRRVSDGTRRRSYLCANVKHGTGLCDAPVVHADPVEAHIAEHLRGFFLDFEQWARTIASERDRDRAVVERDIAKERERRDHAARREHDLADRYDRLLDTGEDIEARACSLALEQRRTDREQAQHRVRELEAILVDLDAPDPADAMFDAYNDLSTGVRARLDRGDVREVNLGLRELFSAFRILTTPVGVRVEPVLRDESLAYVECDALATHGRLVDFPHDASECREGDLFPLFVGTPPARPVVVPDGKGPDPQE